MKKWKTYCSDVRNEKFDSIIIRSGIGGLCAAALQAIKGNRVLVLEKHVTGLKGHIDYQKLLTPLTVRDLANYTYGEMYGLDHSADQFRQKRLMTQSSRKNLYLVVQDITSVGISGAPFSGLLTASAVHGQALYSLLKN